MELDRGEAMLRAWLELTATLWSRELVSGLTFNEAVVCNLLRHQAKAAPDTPLTATELCEKTNIKKSQMNQLLTGLSQRGYLTRRRSQSDRRQVYLALTPEGERAYLESHDLSRELLSAVMAQMGPEQAESLTAAMKLANATVQELLARRRQKGTL